MIAKEFFINLLDAGLAYGRNQRQPFLDLPISLGLPTFPAGLQSRVLVIDQARGDMSVVLDSGETYFEQVGA